MDAELKRLAARADVCRLLAACYYEPGPEFAEEALFESLAEAASRLDQSLAGCGAALAREFAAQPLDVLRIDHTRLFLHPTAPQALPYESTWVAGDDPAARQQVADAVVRAYADAGFEVDEGFRDLPDHIAAELEFLYSLLFREAAARHAGDAATRNDAAAARRAFVGRHLGRWVGPFTQAMQAGAETPFYRSLAALTEAFVAAEMDQPGTSPH